MHLLSSVSADRTQSADDARSRIRTSHLLSVAGFICGVSLMVGAAVYYIHYYSR